MQVGDKVKLKRGVPHGREAHTTARIESFLPDVEGGVKLDRRLRGFHYWNVLDLALCVSSGNPAEKP